MRTTMRRPSGVADWASHAKGYHDRPALSLGILLFIVGIQFISSGLLAELFVIGSNSRGSDTGYSVRRVLETEERQPTE